MRKLLHVSLLVAAIGVCLTVTTPIALASCQLVEHFTPEGVSYWTMDCTQYPPVYYEELTEKPNWCDYVVGDRVFVHYDPWLTYDRWIVIPSTDPNQEEWAREYASRGGWGVDWYRVGNCALALFP